MIKLYSFGPKFGLPDPSPFVLKTDLYMRIAGIEFETITDGKNMQNAPKGKLPFIEDKGKVVADSFFILEYLRKEKAVTLDNWLSDEQVAMSHLIGKALEESFYWCIVYSRWMKEETWKLIKQAFFSSMPLPLRLIVPGLIRRGVKGALKKQGIGRHSDEEILLIANRTLKSVSVLLADKPYIMGDKACSLDASVFAFLASVILVDINDPLTQSARKYQNLVDYCQRIQQQYYAEQPV